MRLFISYIIVKGSIGHGSNVSNIVFEVISSGENKKDANKHKLW